jgi:hypothetical protein
MVRTSLVALGLLAASHANAQQALPPRAEAGEPPIMPAELRPSESLTFGLEPEPPMSYEAQLRLELRGEAMRVSSLLAHHMFEVCFVVRMDELRTCTSRCSSLPTPYEQARCQMGCARHTGTMVDRCRVAAAEWLNEEFDRRTAAANAHPPGS